MEEFREMEFNDTVKEVSFESLKEIINAKRKNSIDTMEQTMDKSKQFSFESLKEVINTSKQASAKSSGYILDTSDLFSFESLEDAISASKSTSFKSSREFDSPSQSASAKFSDPDVSLGESPSTKRSKSADKDTSFIKSGSRTDTGQDTSLGRVASRQVSRNPSGQVHNESSFSRIVSQKSSSNTVGQQIFQKDAVEATGDGKNEVGEDIRSSKDTSRRDSRKASKNPSGLVHNEGSSTFNEQNEVAENVRASKDTSRRDSRKASKNPSGLVHDERLSAFVENNEVVPEFRSSQDTTRRDSRKASKNPSELVHDESLSAFVENNEVAEDVRASKDTTRRDSRKATKVTSELVHDERLFAFVENNEVVPDVGSSQDTIDKASRRASKNSSGQPHIESTSSLDGGNEVAEDVRSSKPFTRKASSKVGQREEEENIGSEAVSRKSSAEPRIQGSRRPTEDDAGSKKSISGRSQSDPRTQDINPSNSASRRASRSSSKQGDRKPSEGDAKLDKSPSPDLLDKSSKQSSEQALDSINLPSSKSPENQTDSVLQLPPEPDTGTSPFSLKPLEEDISTKDLLSQKTWQQDFEASEPVSRQFSQQDEYNSTGQQASPKSSGEELNTDNETLKQAVSRRLLSLGGSADQPLLPKSSEAEPNTSKTGFDKTTEEHIKTAIGVSNKTSAGDVGETDLSVPTSPEQEKDDTMPVPRKMSDPGTTASRPGSLRPSQNESKTRKLSSTSSKIPVRKSNASKTSDQDWTFRKSLASNRSSAISETTERVSSRLPARESQRISVKSPKEEVNVDETDSFEAFGKAVSKSQTAYSQEKAIETKRVSIKVSVETFPIGTPASETGSNLTPLNEITTSGERASSFQKSEAVSSEPSPRPSRQEKTSTIPVPRESHGEGINAINSNPNDTSPEVVDASKPASSQSVVKTCQPGTSKASGEVNDTCPVSSGFSAERKTTNPPNSAQSTFQEHPRETADPTKPEQLGSCQDETTMRPVSGEELVEENHNHPPCQFTSSAEACKNAFRQCVTKFVKGGDADCSGYVSRSTSSKSNVLQNESVSCKDEWRRDYGYPESSRWQDNGRNENPDSICTRRRDRGSQRDRSNEPMESMSRNYWEPNSFSSEYCKKLLGNRSPSYDPSIRSRPRSRRDLDGSSYDLKSTPRSSMMNRSMDKSDSSNDLCAGKQNFDISDNDPCSRFRRSRSDFGSSTRVLKCRCECNADKGTQTEEEAEEEMVCMNQEQDCQTDFEPQVVPEFVPEFVPYDYGYYPMPQAQEADYNERIGVFKSVVKGMKNLFGIPSTENTPNNQYPQQGYPSNTQQNQQQCYAQPPAQQYNMQPPAQQYNMPPPAQQYNMQHSATSPPGSSLQYTPTYETMQPMYGYEPQQQPFPAGAYPHYVESQGATPLPTHFASSGRATPTYYRQAGVLTPTSPNQPQTVHFMLTSPGDGNDSPSPYSYQNTP